MVSPVDALAFGELVAEGQATLVQIGDAIDGYYGWAAGTATGGPNGDGYYPLPAPGAPGSILVPCPAKIATIAEEGGAPSTQLTAAAVNQLPAATTSDGQEWYPAVSPDGELRRYRPEMFASRKTADLDVLPGSEYAEWLSCLSSTGLERKLAVSALTRAVGEVIDPTKPPYNVRYDFQKAKPSYATAGSHIIQTGDPVFSASDVGKLVNVGGGSTGGALVGYIGQVQDSTHIAIYTDLTFTTPATATATATNEMVWGTDNTVGLQQAFNDAEVASIYNTGRVVLIGGMALASELRFGSIAIVGLGATACGFAALAKSGSQQPFFADKITGRYATLRPDAYTLKGLSFMGQRYTQFYNTFRRNIEVRGGAFAAFRRGAPYARIEEIDTFESLWDGGAFSGAFAGQFNNIRAYFNAQCGLRMGFWDLNGQNWHVEANGGAGVLSLMPGANVSTVRASYNGSGGGRIFTGGGYWPNQLGANWTECGFGNTVTNLRMQESWGHSLVIARQDPLNGASSAGSKNAFFLGTFDDTANIVPGHGGNNTRLPGVRAMVFISGNTAVNNTVDLVTGSGQVQPTNYATNAYWDEGEPSGNRVTLNTPGITNATSDWYAGNATVDTLATAPGPWGTSSSSSIGGRGNIVTINGQSAP